MAVLVLPIALCCARAQTASPAPPTATPSLAAAQQLIESGHPAEAIPALRELAGRRPVVKGAAHALGIACYRTGKLLEAKSAFAQAILEDGADMESVQMEGLTLYRLGQPAAAIPYLQRVQQWMPHANANASYVLGLCYLNAQRYDEARQSFAAQYGVKPDSAQAYLLLGRMLQTANFPELAAAAARKAVALDASLPLAHELIGEVALFKGDLPTALSEFDLERDINPGFAPIYDRLGDTYLRMGKLEQAQEALMRSLSLDTSSTGAFILMGKVLLRRQDMQSAVMYLKHAEKMDPANYTTHTLLGQAYRRLGQEAEAKAELEQAAAIHADSELKLQPVQ